MMDVRDKAVGQRFIGCASRVTESAGKELKSTPGDAFGLTSSTGAVSTIPVAALDADSHHTAVLVLGVVRVDVTGAATAVRSLRHRHGELCLGRPSRPVAVFIS